MTQLKFKSAGVSARVINLTGPTAIKPSGIPAGVIGTSDKGPAFVPKIVATTPDFVVDFGAASDANVNGPLASMEWLRNAQALTFLRILGAGSGKQREDSGNNTGKVARAGFVVGSQLPQRPGGGLSSNQYGTGDEGRAFVLGCFMKQYGSSTIFQDAGLPTEGVPIVRGILMAPSGVLVTLSSSRITNNDVSSAATVALASGSVTGSVNISSGRQEFVLLLNGHNNTDAAYPNVLTASFDPTAPNYLNKILNTDPYKIEDAGHYLYADYKIHPAFAVPSGSTIISGAYGAGAVSGSSIYEDIAFVTTSSISTRNSGSTTAPNFDNFEDRFATAESVWVISQKFGGLEENLFKVIALDDGVYSNGKYKISVENIKPGTEAEPYAIFDLLVRDYADNDKTIVVFESHRGVNLNPGSPNYIARRIGDYRTFFNFEASIGYQKLITEGTFPNKSRYIRVQMAAKVTDTAIDSSAVPFGFRGAPHLVTSGTSPMPTLSDTDYYTKTNVLYDTIQIPVPLRENITKGSSPSKTVDKSLYWGVQFENKTVVAEPNASTVPETNILSFVKYFPNFQTTWADVVVSNNEGTPDTAANGILDADRFLYNKFSLNNVRMTRNQTTDLPDTTKLSEWTYIRAGNVATSGISRSLGVSDLSDSTVRTVAKFSFFIHGGFDGNNIFDQPAYEMTNEAINEEMNYTTRGTSEGSTVSAYNKALDIFADSTEVDIQLLAVPGIRHSIISDRALQVTEARFDALYIMDIEKYDISNFKVSSSTQIDSVNYTATQHAARGINNSFGAAYYPDVIMRDSYADTIRSVPASVAALGAFSKNDAVGHPWFAPAGFTRGALETTEEAGVKLSRDNMDTLVENDINPIVAFPGSEGTVVWGQNTLLATDSALERVNVRRLLISIRRSVKAIGLRMLFEPGRDETLVRFSQLVNPVLKKIQDQKGLENYLVKIDTSTTTPADFENRTIKGKIYLIPTKSLEFISLDFVVTNTSA